MISDIVALRYPNIKRWLHLKRDVCKIYIGFFLLSLSWEFSVRCLGFKFIFSKKPHDIPISVHSWMNRLPFFLFTIDNENFQMCTMFITQTHTQYMAQASTSPYRHIEWILVVPLHVLIMSQLNCSVTWLFSAVIIINKCWVKVVV